MDVIPIDPTIWQQIKEKIPNVEHDEAIRVIGEDLIQKNEQIWEEMASLRDILIEYREHTQLERSQMNRKPLLLENSARNLLEQQIFLLLNSVKNSNDRTVQEATTPRNRGENRVQQYVLRKFASGNSPKVSNRSLDSGRDYTSRSSPLTVSSGRASTGRLSVCSSPGEQLVEGIDGTLNLDAIEKLLKIIRKSLRDEYDDILSRIAWFQELLEMEHEELLEEKEQSIPPSLDEMRKYSTKLEKSWLMVDMESGTDSRGKKTLESQTTVPQLKLPKSSRVTKLRQTVSSQRNHDM